MNPLVAYLLVCFAAIPRSACDRFNARDVVLGVDATELSCAGLGDQNQQLIARTSGLRLGPGEYWKIDCEHRGRQP